MQKPTLSQKLRYHFENTLSAGPIAIIGWLSVISLVIVGLGAVVLVITGWNNPGGDPMNFAESFWQSLMRALDGGSVAGDEGWAFRAIMFLVTLGGIFILAILIGVISNGIEDKIEELRKGRSRVLESDHTLILGWSSKIYSIISELAIANENQKNPRVVVLADRDKVEMEDDIRAKLEDLKNTKVIVRSGSALEASDLEVVNPYDARSIIILSPEEGDADTFVIKTVLAITNSRKRRKEPYHIVAEIKSEDNMQAAELVGNGEAVFVLSGDLISRVTAQTCRQSGLSIVYSELMQFEGDELYFQKEPKLVGKTFKDSLFAYETSSVIGLYTKDGKVLINPPMDTSIGQGDEVIAISEDDDTVILSNTTDYKVNREVFTKAEDDNLQMERTLVLGWNEKGRGILDELDSYVAQGSEVMVLADCPDLEDEMKAVRESLSNHKLEWKYGNISDRDTLHDLGVETFEHVIVLNYTHMGDVQESDAKTLICLLHLRNLADKLGKSFSIVSEMLDIRNKELAEVSQADDFIVSDTLISLMMTQLSENSNLNKVFEILFQAEGSEIYLKPVSNYVKTGVPMNFYTVLESAAERNEIAIGYRISAEENQKSTAYGVYLNPKKSDTMQFAAEDRIIVLAED